MWWDWGQITSMDVILLTILITSILALIGCGFCRLFSVISGHSCHIFLNSDYLQKISYYMFFGYVFLFFITLIFSFLNLPFFSFLLIVIAVATTGFILHSKLRTRFFGREVFKKSVFTFTVLFLLLFLVALSSTLIIGSYGTANADGADHTFFTRLLIDNPSVLWTHSAQPYTNTLIQYPLGTHTLAAFFVTLLDIPIQKVIVILTVMLPALIALSIYSTIKSLFNHRVISIIGLVITGFLSVGFIFAPIWWSGLPLLLSLYLSTSGLGLFFVFLFKEKWNWFNAFLIGLVLLVACETYPVAFLVLSLWFLLLLASKAVIHYRTKIPFSSLISKRNIPVLIAFLIPVLLAVPYLFFAYNYKIDSGRYMTSQLTSSGALTIFRDRLFFNWLNIFEQSVFYSNFANVLALTPFSVFLVVALLIPRINKKSPKVFSSDNFTLSSVLIYVMMLLVIIFLALTLLPIKVFLTFMEPERIWQHIFIFAVILTSIVVFSISHSIHRVIRFLFNNYKVVNGVKLSVNKRKIVGFLIFGILIFNAPIICLSLVNEQTDHYANIKSSFNRNTIYLEDLALMRWIIDNTPKDCSILISQEDSGQFLTAITQRNTVFTELYTVNYRSLMKTLTLNASDPEAIPLLIGFNVTYVYIGSTAMKYDIPQYIYRQFNANQMYTTPYFSLVKQYGNASLFYFNATLASDVYAAVAQKT
jgi:hypothetical protein